MTADSINPVEVFTSIKDSIQKISEDDLNSLKDAAEYLAAKYYKAGQFSALKKLAFSLEVIDKEKQLINMGINTFIYKDDIDFYIDNAKDNTPVKLIELKNYPREIPDEIVETIDKVKNIFDEMYIIYTDYTGKEEKRIEAEKRSTDPILFGVFMNTTNRVCVDRFYVLGDWIDEHCDLTLDKLLYELKLHKRYNRDVYVPMSLNELKGYLNNLNSNISFDASLNSSTPYLVVEKTPEKELSFFDKVRTFFKKH